MEVETVDEGMNEWMTTVVMYAFSVFAKRKPEKIQGLGFELFFRLSFRAYFSIVHNWNGYSLVHSLNSFSAFGVGKLVFQVWRLVRHQLSTFTPSNLTLCTWLYFHCPKWCQPYDFTIFLGLSLKKKWKVWFKHGTLCKDKKDDQSMKSITDKQRFKLKFRLHRVVFWESPSLYLF